MPKKHRQEDYTMQLALKNMSLTIDFETGTVTSLQIGGKERLAGSTPLFSSM